VQGHLEAARPLALDGHPPLLITVRALLTLGHVPRELGAKHHNLERELGAPAAVAETLKLNDAPIGRCAPACRRSTPRFGISRLKIETASPAPTSAGLIALACAVYTNSGERGSRRKSTA